MPLLIQTQAELERLFNRLRVEPLLAVKSQPPRDAVRKIQERLGDAEAGRLSLTQANGGELSVAGEAGRLSQVKS